MQKILKMLIGELVKRTGLSKDTIRFYEKYGLISVGRKERRDNNYKEYSEDILKRLLNIKHLKRFGFTLKEVSEMLDRTEAKEATCQKMVGKIQGKIGLLQVKINEMQRVKELLSSQIEKCESRCVARVSGDMCPIVVPR